MIDSFSREYFFLSNFYKVEIEYEGIIYPTLEHAYQAAKTLDLKERRLIAALSYPGQAKRVGRALKLREDWSWARYVIMEELVRHKFSNHPTLRARLLNTGDAELVEGNTWGDTHWGMCKGKGRNELGKILMKVRENFR